MQKEAQYHAQFYRETFKNNFCRFVLCTINGIHSKFGDITDIAADMIAIKYKEEKCLCAYICGMYMCTYVRACACVCWYEQYKYHSI